MYQIGTRSSALLACILITASTACTTGRSEPTATPSPGTSRTTAGRGAMELPLAGAYERAVSQGTRSRSGAPGPRYWQQWADYRLEAELNPVSKRLTGKGTVTYQNRSPDTLREVYVHLLHNLFAPG